MLDYYIQKRFVKKRTLEAIASCQKKHNMIKKNSGDRIKSTTDSYYYKLMYSQLAAFLSEIRRMEKRDYTIPGFLIIHLAKAEHAHQFWKEKVLNMEELSAGFEKYKDALLFQEPMIKKEVAHHYFRWHLLLNANFHKQFIKKPNL